MPLGTAPRASTTIGITSLSRTSLIPLPSPDTYLLIYFFSPDMATVMSGRLCSITWFVCLDPRGFPHSMTGSALCWFHCIERSQVVTVCYIHLICVQLSILCPCTICILYSPCCLSILTLIALFLIAWSCSAIKIPSISLLKPPAVSQAQFFEQLSMEQFCHPFIFVFLPHPEL